MTNIVAFSGGKDSTALALAMCPRYLLHTPTANELPAVARHVRDIARRCVSELIIPPGPSLPTLIGHFNAVPNPRMRWCTRMIKIQPAKAWLAAHVDFRLAVGLRADEPTRDGIYDMPPERYWFPLREWGWGIAEVERILQKNGVKVPARTDCAVCPYQRLGEWFRLWRDWPDAWAQGEAWEAMTGHTFRMESRDTWPAAMVGLRRRFEQGDVPRGASDMTPGTRCRVCTL
jgi:3'-phosphoadenosine 5'-phosphosulfate sulfotransferase (PAPS reductase)/FAD synthetase